MQVRRQASGTSAQIKEDTRFHLTSPYCDLWPCWKLSELQIKGLHTELLIGKPTFSRATATLDWSNLRNNNNTNHCQAIRTLNEQTFLTL